MKIKRLLNHGLSILAVGILAAILGTWLSNSSDNSSNYINTNSQIELNNEIDTNDSSIFGVNKKAAVKGNFLLNSDNAITLDNPTEFQTSLSITNGPEGYLSQSGSDIIYTGYDGKIIWTQNLDNSNDQLISSYYDTKGYFVCLIQTKNSSDSFVSSFQLKDGKKSKTTEKYIPDYIYPVVSVIEMIPIQKSDSQYLITYRHKNGHSTNVVYPEIKERNFLIVQLQKDGSLTINSNSVINFGLKLSPTVIISAGAITYNNVIYLITLENYFNNLYYDGQFICVYSNSNSLVDPFQYITSFHLNNLDTTYNFLNNIPELYLTIKNDGNIDITGIINYNTSVTQLFSGYYNIERRTLSDLGNRIINLEQTTDNILNYDINKGRIYGDYLYAYLDVASSGGIVRNNKIMRLKLWDTLLPDWSTNGLQWNNDYNNTRIVLYDTPYLDGNSVIGLPIYSPNYNGNNNLFSLSNTKNLYLLDGTKAAYAYNTSLKDPSNTTINIPGVSNTNPQYVTDEELMTLLQKNDILLNFSQYQIGTNFSVINKYTPSNPINKFDQGIICVTLTINNGYDNSSFNTIKQIFDIELSGFQKTKTTQLATSGIIGGFPDVLASGASINQIRQILFDKRNEIFVQNSLPNSFTIDNIIIITKSDVNDSTGTISVSFYLNNYINENNIIVSNPNKPFGPLIISGFLTSENNLIKTSINSNPTTNTDLKNILAQNIKDLSNAQVRNYLFNNVVEGSKNGINSNDIKSIIVESYDNSSGTLVLNQITLSKWYDNKGLLQMTDRTFDQSVTINGFKQVLATTVKPSVQITGYDNVYINYVTNTEIKNWLSSNRNFDLAFNDLPDNFIAGNIVSVEIINDSIKPLDGALNANIVINNYYADDNIKTLTTSNSSPFILTITGFKITGPTSKISNASIDANKPNVNADDVTVTEFTQLIKNQFSLVIENLPDEFTANNIVNVTKNSVDNDLGYLYVNVELNLYFNSIGQLINNSDNNLILEKIIISGYKNNKFPEIRINNIVDIALFDTSYNKRIAEDVINHTNNVLATTWLHNPNIFRNVVTDPKNLNPTDFSVKSIENIDNILGTIKVIVQVNNPELGVIDPANNLLTFSGFRQSLSLNDWIRSILRLTGIANNQNDIINDIKNRIVQSSTLGNSPFISQLNPNNIDVKLNSTTIYNVMIKNSRHIGINNSLASSNINFNVSYTSTSTNEATNNDWLIYTAVAIGSIILICVAIILFKITKKHRNRNNFDDDYGF